MKPERWNLLYHSVFTIHTCALCAGSHGGVFRPGTEPALPRHPNCRCYYTQVDPTIWKPNHINWKKVPPAERDEWIEWVIFWLGDGDDPDQVPDAYKPLIEDARTIRDERQCRDRPPRLSFIVLPKK